MIDLIEYSGSKLLEQLADDLYELLGVETRIEADALICDFPLLDWQPCLSLENWQDAFYRLMEDFQLKYDTWLEVTMDNEIKINSLV